MKDALSGLMAMKAMSEMMEGPDKPTHNLSLEAMLASYNEPSVFRPGDLVAWKEGLSNKSVPKDGENAVVVEVLEEPIVSSEEETASMYFREKLDLRLAVKRGDTLAFFHYDSKRFRLVKRYMQEGDI